MSFVHRITSGLAGASLTGMGKAGSTQQTRKSLFEVNEGTATALALAAPRDICGPDHSRRPLPSGRPNVTDHPSPEVT